MKAAIRLPVGDTDGPGRPPRSTWGDCPGLRARRDGGDDGARLRIWIAETEHTVDS